MSSLQGLIRTQKKSPSLLSTHIKLLTAGAQQGVSDKGKVLNTAKKYTSRVPEAACVWLARLEAVQTLTGKGDTEDVWAEARRSISVSHEDVSTVWTWGLASLPQEPKRKVHEVCEFAGYLRPDILIPVFVADPGLGAHLQELLRESMRDAALKDVHETLLMSYLSSLSATERGEESRLANVPSQAENWKSAVRHMQRTCLPTGKVWQRAFMLAKQGSIGENVLREIYETWRRVEESDAIVEWARYLFENGKAKEATDVVLRSKNRAIEDRWAKVMEQKV